MRQILLTLCLIGIVGLSNGIAKEKLNWRILDMAPLEATGKNGPWGYAIDVQKRMKVYLTGYKHMTEEVTVARALAEMENGNSICLIGWFKTPEREKIAHISIPAFLHFPPVIVMLKDTHKQLGSPQQVSLAELLQNKNLDLGSK